MSEHERLAPDLEKSLADEDGDGAAETLLLHSREPRPSTSFSLIVTLVLTNVISIIFTALLSQYAAPNNTFEEAASNSVWSPANEAVTYTRQTFSRGFADSPYMGYPTSALDQAWRDLLPNEVVALQPFEAAQLLNATARIPEQPDVYISSLEVFHQLHCLNMIRQHLYPEYYSGDSMKSLVHIEHCIENLRLALVCTGDVTPISFLYEAEKQRIMPAREITKVCRRFDRILEWAEDHRLDEGIADVS